MNVDEAETKLNTRPMVKERAEAAAAAARVAMLELESASESEVESGLRRVGNVPTKQVVAAAAAAGGGTAAAAILQSVQLSSGSSVAPSCLAESYVPRTAHFAALLLCFFGFDLLFTAMRRVCAMAGGKVRRCSEPVLRLLPYPTPPLSLRQLQIKICAQLWPTHLDKMLVPWAVSASECVCVCVSV